MSGPATQFRQSRVVVIGVGAVGATTAYTLFLRGRAAEIVLIDVDAQRARGEALDMQHGRPFVGEARIRAGDYDDCANADIVIIAAGLPQKPGQTREALLADNAAIMETIVRKVTQRLDSRGILLIATNPVDTLAYLAWRASEWPACQVLGSGTLLDSARFRYLLGRELGVDPRSVHAHVVGEHGDTEVPIWSGANLAGVGIEIATERRAELATLARNAGYDVIQAKGYTSYAIALALDRICAAVLNDEHAILCVSTLLTNYHDISGVYMSVPCVVGRSGVERVIEVPFTGEELGAFRRSANELTQRIDNLRQQL